MNRKTAQHPTTQPLDGLGADDVPAPVGVDPAGGVDWDRFSAEAADIDRIIDRDRARVSREMSPDELNRRRRAGRAADDAGKHFERGLQYFLLLLQQQGLIRYWEHNRPGFRRVGKRFIHTEASGADYAGILRGGYAFALEAKSTGTRPNGKLNPFERDRVSMRQQMHLEQAHLAGAPALIVLEFRPKGAPLWFLAPWAKIDWHGKKSIRAEELTEWAIGEGDFRRAFQVRCEQAIGRAI